MISTLHFPSRNQIIHWVNSILDVQLTKIQQLGSGNLYCQILDAAYPEKIPLNKVKWQAYLEVDFLHNFKILQTAFDRLGIPKAIETQKLAKAKYQDNLEFIQWMKSHFSPLIAEHTNYNPWLRRGNIDPYLLFTERRPEDGKMKEQKLKMENKENMVKSVVPKESKSVLRSYKSTHQLKKLNISQSLKQLQEGVNKKGDGDASKWRSGLAEKVCIGNIQVVESDEEECF